MSTRNSIMCSSYLSVGLMLGLSILANAQESGQVQDFDLLSRQATTSTPRPLFGSVPYSVAITNCVVPGAVALTYDDGPGPYTAQLLDTLQANGIHATFFILGNRNGSGPIDQMYPDLIRRMYQAGHQIASHTWDHQSLESLTQVQRIAEMTKNEAAFTNILGFFPTYMRPPYGFCYGPSGCLSDMANLGYHVIDWSVDTKDYENDSPTLIVNAEHNWDAVFQPANPLTSSFIPLTHDIHQNTVQILAPYMIQEIKQRGYKFLTVGECLNDPRQNWYRNPSTGQAVTISGTSQKGLSGNTSSTTTPTSSQSTTTTVSRLAASVATTGTPSVVLSTSSSTHSVSGSATTSQPAKSAGVNLAVNVLLYTLVPVVALLEAMTI